MISNELSIFLKFCENQTFVILYAPRSLQKKNKLKERAFGLFHFHVNFFEPQNVGWSIQILLQKLLLSLTNSFLKLVVFVEKATKLSTPSLLSVKKIVFRI